MPIRVRLYYMPARGRLSPAGEYECEYILQYIYNTRHYIYNTSVVYYIAFTTHVVYVISYIKFERY